MRVRILAPSPGNGEHQFLTTFLINDTVAIDAGCLGFVGGPREQARVGTIFLSHSHSDHTCSLPMLLMNTEDEATRPIAVYGHPDVLHSLRADIFNGRVWPNFLGFTRDDGSAFANLIPLQSGCAVTADGLTVTPVAIDHVVPTFGFAVDDGRSTVLFSSDSGPTEALWAHARSTGRVAAAFMGVAFPNALADRATMAGHLTPNAARCEIAKLPANVSVIVVHIKASHRATVTTELASLGVAGLSVGELGREYVL